MKTEFDNNLTHEQKVRLSLFNISQVISALFTLGSMMFFVFITVLCMPSELRDLIFIEAVIGVILMSVIYYWHLKNWSKTVKEFVKHYHKLNLKGGKK